MGYIGRGMNAFRKDKGLSVEEYNARGGYQLAQEPKKKARSKALKNKKGDKKGPYLAGLMPN